MNLTNLISNLRRVDISKYNKLFRYQCFLNNYRSNDWLHFLDKTKINNFQKNLIQRDNNFEMFLINWPVEYQSNIHNHADYGCLMKVLQGSLQENIYSKQLDLLETKFKTKGNVSYIDDSIGYHSINTLNDLSSVSIHIYSPPLHKTDYY